MAAAECECPLCRMQAYESTDDDHYAKRGFVKIECRSCGVFFVTDETTKELNGWDELRRARLSGVTRERWERKSPLLLCSSGYTASTEDAIGIGIDEVERDHAPRFPLEALDRALLNLAHKSQYLGDVVEVEGNKDWPLLFAGRPGIAGHILKHMASLDLLVPDGNVGSRRVLTVKGWERVRELQHSPPESRQGFVAMWFSPETEDAWTQGIEPAIAEMKYNPFRVDMAEFNDKIDDRIIDGIRRSHFAVVDMTGHRNAVYFEAGFAMGLGLPVIYTCRKGELGCSSFDTRQYNHIEWESPAQLREKLRVRIGATVGVATSKAGPA